MSSFNKLCAVLLVSTTLSGCASLLPKGPPAPRLYALNAAAPTHDAGAALPVSLKIVKPQAAPGLETDRIALHKTRNQLDYYADAKWAADVATLLQTTLVKEFDATRRLQGVSNDLTPVKSDYTLLIDIADFQIDRKDENSQAHVGLSVKLVDTLNDKIVQTLRYDEFAAVQVDDMASVVSGFDRAQQAAGVKLVEDVLQILPRQKVEKTASQTIVKPTAIMTPSLVATPTLLP